MLVTLVNATDLATWAASLDARGRLPELVRKLVLATAVDIKRLEMRSGEGIQYPGWDGLTEIGQGNAFAPNGLAVWEMGVDADIRAKVDKEYEKRTNDPLDIDPTAATFIFVTLRRWARKERWVAEKTEGGPWKDVRVIDADNLEAWLELAPAVHSWISQYLRKVPDDIQDLETFWANWRATSPPLSIDLVISGRDESAERIAEHLHAQAGALTLRADSQNEAIAFIAAASDRLPESERASVFSRAIIVKSEQAWRQIVSFGQPLILLPTFDQTEVVQATRKGHIVLVPTGRETPEASAAVNISRPNRQAAEDALKAMGLSNDQASPLALLQRRSPLSLRRKLAVNPEVQLPEWAKSERASAILPAVLAGSWDESQEGDRDVLANLSGRPYDEFIRDINFLANKSDPPFRRVGTKWFVVSNEDIWLLLYRFLTQQDIKRFKEVVSAVLGAIDPRLELPADEQWMAAVRGKSRPHSGLVRKGLADTLALMAARSGDRPLAGTATGQNLSTSIVHDLLKEANRDRSGKIWSSLTDVLPLVAEAAPDAFLQAVDDGTSGTDPVILSLFTDGGGDMLTSRSAHTGLLWALERVAWAEECLARSAPLLARLDRLDPGGRIANRPSRSLREIFLFWHPQTAASVERRLEVIDMLRKREPDAAWKLMLALLPKSHDFAMPTNQPRWRDWKPEESKKFTYGELWKSAEEIITRLLEDMDTDTSRICSIIENISSLPQSSRAAALGHLEALNPSRLDDAARGAVWGKLREVIYRHRRFADAQWAMPKHDVDCLSRLYMRFQPKNSIDRIAWLFTQWPELPDVDEKDHEKYRQAVFEKQASACQALYRAGGINSLFALAEVAEHSGVLGWALGKSRTLTTEEDIILGELASSQTSRRQLAASYVAGRFQQGNWKWADKKLVAKNPLCSSEQRAEFLLALPSNAETWNRLERCDSATKKLYWSKLHPLYVESSYRLKAIDSLLEYGRAWAALDLLASCLHGEGSLPTAGQVIQVLNTALHSPMDYQNRSLHYDIGRLLDYLYECDDVDEAELASIEWAFLPLFRVDKRPMKILHQHLATDPAFFVEVVSLAYRAKDEKPRDLDQQEQHRAETAHHLLHSWQQVPGADERGVIDAETLTAWVTRARDLLAEAKRTDIGDQLIGCILRYAQPDTGKSWPPRVVRELIETLGSTDIEQGIEIEVYNSRGVTSRGLADGGAQERKLAKQYRTCAKSFQAQWPRTAAMLTRIADGYESDARREDVEAELNQDQW